MVYVHFSLAFRCFCCLFSVRRAGGFFLLLMACVVNLYIAGTSGVTYVRWGRQCCEGKGATLIYKGSLPLHTVTVLNTRL